MKFTFLVIHGAALVLGFALGIYALPILIAPQAPDADSVVQASQQAQYSGEFKRDLAGSDFFHWGEGKVSVGAAAVTLMGELAPGPDYRLYLAPSFVEDEAGFLAIKDSSLEIGPVRTFENFVVPVQQSVDLSAYNAVVVWCETFGELITAANYR